MIPKVLARSDGSVSVDWTAHKAVGGPAGPFIVLSAEQWAGLLVAIRRIEQGRRR